MDSFSKMYYTQSDGTFLFAVHRTDSPRIRTVVVAEYDPAVWDFLIAHYDHSPAPAAFTDVKLAKDVPVGQYL